MGKLTAWAEKILSAPECVKVLGKIQMCAKPIKPTCVEDVVVKKEEKKAAPAPAAKKAVDGRAECEFPGPAGRRAWTPRRNRYQKSETVMRCARSVPSVLPS